MHLFGAPHSVPHWTGVSAPPPCKAAVASPTSFGHSSLSSHSPCPSFWTITAFVRLASITAAFLQVSQPDSPCSNTNKLPRFLI